MCFKNNHIKSELFISSTKFATGAITVFGNQNHFGKMKEMNEISERNNWGMGSLSRTKKLYRDAIRPGGPREEKLSNVTFIHPGPSYSSVAWHTLNTFNMLERMLRDRKRSTFTTQNSLVVSYNARDAIGNHNWPHRWVADPNGGTKNFKMDRRSKKKHQAGLNTVVPSWFTSGVSNRSFPRENGSKARVCTCE